MVAITLDAWTSSNQYAFMAIVLHYVTEGWEVGMLSHIHSFALSQVVDTEEVLIDFREIIGQHSGENLADSVWQTLELYGFIGKVSSSCQPCATSLK